MASLKEDDEIVQEAALNELTELMSMSSEEALSVLPLEQLVPQLVTFLLLAACSGMGSSALHEIRCSCAVCSYIHYIAFVDQGGLLQVSCMYVSHVAIANSSGASQYGFC